MIYPRRYVNEPRKRKAYCDACDAIAVYGIARENFRYKDVSRTEMAEIWNFAAVDMMGKGKYDKIYIYEVEKYEGNDNRGNRSNNVFVPTEQTGRGRTGNRQKRNRDRVMFMGV